MKKINFATLLILSAFLYAGLSLAGEPKEVFERQHFVIYHNDRIFANDISWKAEGHYKSIIMHLGVQSFRPWEGKEKCPIYLFDTRDDYIKYTGAPVWSAGIAQMKPLQLSIFKGASDLKTTTLPHEITHLVLFKFFEKEPPLWLTEGLAQFEEEASGKTFHKRALKDLISEGGYIKIKDIFSLQGVPEDHIGLFYLESLSIVEFLIRGHLRGLFGKFLDEIKKGRSAEDALKSVYQWKYAKGAEDFEKAWINYVRTRY